MAIGAFPLAKLGALLLKQISKPLANAVKNRAKRHPVFRSYVCMPPAQFYNWCEVQYKMYLLNLGKPVEVPKLSENQAIELGANILGEGIIFIIAAVVLIAEYRRQVNKESAKEDARIEELNSIRNTINDIYFDTQKNNAEIKELLRHVHYLESELKKYPPPQPPSEPINEQRKPFDIDPQKLDDNKDITAPSKINYLYKEYRTKQELPLGNGHDQRTSIYEEQPIIKKNSILSALRYLEDEDILLSSSRDNYIEREQCGVVMEALDYLESDVFKNSSDNNVIYVLRNAPYASQYHY